MTNKIDEKLAKGYIHFNAILEIVGKPKEHVDSTFSEYIKQIRQNQKFEIVSEYVEPSIKAEGSENLFSSFAELEVLVKNIGGVLDFCSECMPASIEIIAPSEIRLRANEASSAVNDLIGRIHQVDLQAKQMTQQSSVLIQNLRIAIQNGILIYLAQKPRTAEQISTAVGVAMPQLPALMKQLIGEGKIVEIENNHFAIAGANISKKEIPTSTNEVIKIEAKNSNNVKTEKSTSEKKKGQNSDNKRNNAKKVK